MDSDRLYEKKNQDIFDRIDKDEFLFNMNDLEGKEYSTFPNGSKMTDILNEKMDSEHEISNNNNSKTIDDQLLRFGDYINSYDEYKIEHKKDNLLFKIDDTEGDETFDETEKYCGSDEEGYDIKITNDKNETISYSSTTTMPIKIQSSNRQQVAGSLGVSDDSSLLASSPNIPVAPPPSLAKSQNMFKIFKNNEEIIQADRKSTPIPEGELNEKNMQELLAKLVIHQDKQN